MVVGKKKNEVQIAKITLIFRLNKGKILLNIRDLSIGHLDKVIR